MMDGNHQNIGAIWRSTSFLALDKRSRIALSVTDSLTENHKDGKFERFIEISQSEIRI
jgi:hypothetical protein